MSTLRGWPYTMSLNVLAVSTVTGPSLSLGGSSLLMVFSSLPAYRVGYPAQHAPRQCGRVHQCSHSQASLAGQTARSTRDVPCCTLKSSMNLDRADASAFLDVYFASPPSWSWITNAGVSCSR